MLGRLGRDQNQNQNQNRNSSVGTADKMFRKCIGAVQFCNLMIINDLIWSMCGLEVFLGNSETKELVSQSKPYFDSLIIRELDEMPSTESKLPKGIGD